MDSLYVKVILAILLIAGFIFVLRKLTLVTDEAVSKGQTKLQDTIKKEEEVNNGIFEYN